QTIELWALYDDSSSQLVNTFTDVDTSDNQTLSFKFAAPKQVRTIVVRTVRSNVNVGWREIRLFAPLPPALGTWTPTPTVTPNTTAVPTSSVPTPVAAQIFATQVSASSSASGTSPQSAVDFNETTFWRPASGDGAPELDVTLTSPQPVSYVR